MLTLLTGLAARTGDLDHAVHIASRVGTVFSRKLPLNLLHLFHHGLVVVDRYLSERGRALHAVTSAAARAGELHDAQAIANSAVDVEDRRWLLLSIVEIAALGGDLDRAQVVTSQIHGTLQSTWAHALIAEARRDYEDNPIRVANLLHQAEVRPGVPTSSEQRLWVLTKLIESAARCGYLEVGWNLVEQLNPPWVPHVDVLERPPTRWSGDTNRYPHARAMAALATAVAGDRYLSNTCLIRGENHAHQIGNPCERAFALTWMARTNAELGDDERAAGLLRLAETTAHTITDAGEQALALWAVAAQEADADRAEQILHAITDPGRRVQALLEFAADPARRRPATIAKALQLGHWTQAAELLTEMEPEALAALTEELEKLRAAGSRTA
jgi:hypothetical protein